ncbi:MAG: DUF4922 domain-containing protein [Marinifilaceae bacterium]|jgi:ATP adenylyltransferase/5',5'''-P-1,P-4-tetraphosphate phosphorylase II|nr:DUF4922 domain-containing protein [Marinifilaceae bacterium]
MNSSDLFEFFKQQLKTWEIADKNYKALENQNEKTVILDEYEYKIQYNPNRVFSTKAKIDKKSIESRKCFLCNSNLFKEQDSVNYKSKFDFLLNPYPIMPMHFTIPNMKHVDQQISPYFTDFLDLIVDFPEMLFMYNGAKCGASLPDHMHFQAIKQNLLPIERINADDKNIKCIYAKSKEFIYVSTLEYRSFLILESDNKLGMKYIYDKIINQFSDLYYGDYQDKINLIGKFINNKYRIYIFPRSAHRPYQYYSKNDNSIIISPGCIDMGGVFICSDFDSFNRMNSSYVKSILSQVSMGEKKFQKFIDNFKKQF